MINKTEFTIDYNQLYINANHWQRGEFYRFYMPDAHPNIKVFISGDRDRKGKHEVKLNNGYLYLDKSYGNLLYHAERIIEYLVEIKCLTGDIGNIEVDGPAESNGPTVIDIINDLRNEVSDLKNRVDMLEKKDR